MVKSTLCSCRGLDFNFQRPFWAAASNSSSGGTQCLWPVWTSGLTCTLTPHRTSIHVIKNNDKTNLLRIFKKQAWRLNLSHFPSLLVNTLLYTLLPRYAIITRLPPTRANSLEPLGSRAKQPSALYKVPCLGYFVMVTQKWTSKSQSWHTPIVPAPWETEIRRSLELMNARQTRST